MQGIFRILLAARDVEACCEHVFEIPARSSSPWRSSAAKTGSYCILYSEALSCYLSKTTAHGGRFRQPPKAAAAFGGCSVQQPPSEAAACGGRRRRSPLEADFGGHQHRLPAAATELQPPAEGGCLRQPPAACACVGRRRRPQWDLAAAQHILFLYRTCFSGAFLLSVALEDETQLHQIEPEI